MVLAELGKCSTNDDRGNKNHWHKDCLSTAVLFSYTAHKFVKIVYGQLFHLSAVMAGINRPLNTGSCEISILWLVASGITVVILIRWNISLQCGAAALFHLTQSEAADGQQTQTQANDQIVLRRLWRPLVISHLLCIVIKGVYCIHVWPRRHLIGILCGRFWKIMGLIWI